MYVYHFIFYDVVLYLLEADDALAGVAVSGDGEGVGALWVDDGVLDVGVHPQVLVVSLDLAHRLAHLGRLRHVQLVVLCGKRKPSADDDDWPTPMSIYGAFVLMPIWLVDNNDRPILIKQVFFNLSLFFFVFFYKTAQKVKMFDVYSTQLVDYMLFIRYNWPIPINQFIFHLSATVHYVLLMILIFILAINR